MSDLKVINRENSILNFLVLLPPIITPIIVVIVVVVVAQTQIAIALTPAKKMMTAKSRSRNMKK